MTTQVLFIQGGGEGAHECDSRLAADLQGKLGSGYAVRYPLMPNESDPNYRAWSRCIGQELRPLGHDVVLVAHSVGASVLVRFLAENAPENSLAGIFLVAAPFLREPEGWQSEEAQLPADAADKLPPRVPLFLYQGRDDEVVPFAHLALYARTFPNAVVRELDGRDHQLNDDLTEVANDILRIRRVAHDES
jgi:predicted alpha/beta hydrolase family esterase